MSLRIETTTDGTNNLKQSDNLKKALDGFKYHIDKLIKEQVSQDELEAAKLQLKSKLKFALEGTGAKNSNLSSSMLTPYRNAYNEEFLRALDNITAEDVQKIAVHFLSKPSVISIIASENTIKANENYLKWLGKYKQY